MAKSQTNQPSPVCIRLTTAERDQLQAAAGGKTISAYIRSRIFDSDKPMRAVRVPKPDQTALAQVLALLGQSQLATELRDLTALAKIGALPASPESEAAIKRACTHISEIRIALFKALGLTDRGEA